MDFKAFLPHLSLVEALNAAQFSGSRPRVVLGREKIEEIVKLEASSSRDRVGAARLEPGGDNSEDDNVEMVTEIVEKEPREVDLKDSSELKTELSDTHLLADLSDAASRLSDDSITQNADFVAFGS